MPVQDQKRLIAKIEHEINRFGPITFSRFMETALYEQDVGYYMTHCTPSEPRAGLSSPIGWQGDFFTAPYLYPLLAKALVYQVVEVDQILGSPPDFHLVEMGGGEGLLARDILSECDIAHPSLFRRLKYILIDRSPRMEEIQRNRLIPLLEKGAQVDWVDSLHQFGAEQVTGLFLSNELVDAFPVHRVRMNQGELEELFVDIQDEQCVERWMNPSTPALNKFLNDLGIQLPEGFVTEINLHALVWMKKVSRIMGSGVVITIDYGHTAQDYVSPSRNRGTLLCYYRHQVHENPFEHVGDQDMTAHVNFSSLALQGEREGLSVTGFTDLMHFLLGLEIESMVGDSGPEAPNVQAAMQLLNPQGMGRTFKILVQHKGMKTPVLSGLRHRPFFENVLLPSQRLN